MGLLFPECFKTSPMKTIPNSKYRNINRSSSSSSRTLVDFNFDDDDGPYIERKIYQTLNNQYIVTKFVPTLLNYEKIDDTIYDDNIYTDEEEDSTEDNLSNELTTNFQFNKLYTLFSCKKCHNHICISNLIISTNFTGQSGDLFLVSSLINFELGLLEKKQMITGCYEVCDVNCKQCGEYLGWKYLKADSRREKYKIGKYVIEKLLFEEINVLNG